MFIDDSHAMALVRGFKRKYADRIHRKPRPLIISIQEQHRPNGKTIKKIIDHACYVQRLLGNCLTEPDFHHGSLCAHNIVIEDNRIKVSLIECNSSRISAGPTGITITDHALARFLQREGRDDVELAIKILGLQLLILCMQMEEHSKKCGLPLKEDQEIEAMTCNGGYVFLEVGKVDPRKPMFMAEIYLKTYISPDHVDGRNGHRPAIFEQRMERAY